MSFDRRHFLGNLDPDPDVIDFDLDDPDDIARYLAVRHAQVERERAQREES